MVPEVVTEMLYWKSTKWFAIRSTGRCCPLAARAQPGRSPGSWAGAALVPGPAQLRLPGRRSPGAGPRRSALSVPAQRSAAPPSSCTRSSYSGSMRSEGFSPSSVVASRLAPRDSRYLQGAELSNRPGPGSPGAAAGAAPDRAAPRGRRCSGSSAVPPGPQGRTWRCRRSRRCRPCAGASSRSRPAGGCQRRISPGA